MNEELRIIITAVTSEAQRSISGVRQELSGVSGEAKKASGGFKQGMKGFATGALIAVGAIAAVGAAIVKLGKQSLELQRAHAKLNTAFQSVGASTQQAAESYQNLYRFLGDADTSVEAAAHLAKLTNNQKELAEWTKICQGVYGTFGDSLAIESLTEAANETARVGQVTGTLADALNWAGVSEDEFNTKLAQTTSFEEREALIRSTLNGLYEDAAEIYEKNNKALLEYNESQAKLDTSMAAAGASVTPLLTALNNLGSALLTSLKPALDVIIPAITTFVNWITRGIEAVLGFFGIVSGSSPTVTAFSNMGSGISGAVQGTNNLTSGLESAATAAEAVKRATAGFDELNILSTSSSSSSNGTGSGSSGTPSYMAPTADMSKFTVEVEETESKTSGFASTMKKVAAELKEVFAPTITAWTGAFDTIKESWNSAKDNFTNGATSIKDGLGTLGSYILGDFIPSVVNGFSTNLAPVFGDVVGFAIEELGKDFEFLGNLFKDVINDVIIPVLDLFSTIMVDTWESIGDVWEEQGKPFLEEWEEATQGIRDTIQQLYDETLKPIVDKIITTLEDAWNASLGPVVEKIISAVLEIGECLLQLYNEFIKPIIDWIVEYIVPYVKIIIEDIIDHVGELLKAIGKILGGVIDVIKGLIQFITGVFTGDWEKAWEGVKNIFTGIWDAIVGVVRTAWTIIKQIFNFDVVGKFFKQTFTNGYNMAKNAFSKAKSGFSNVWSNIKSGFGNVSGWFKNTFSNAWQAVKNVFSRGGKIFDGIKEGILNGLKAVVNGLIGGINKVIAIPFNGINKALNGIKGIEIVGLKPFNWLPTISVPQIPKLATGGIIDKATLAMIGENGKEAVVPLENNTGWIDKLAEKLAARNAPPTKIILQVGEKELGWATIGAINGITQQTGRIQLLI